MHRIIRRIIMVAALLAPAAPVVAGPAGPTLAGDYATHFEQRVREEGIPGAAFAIVTPDAIVHIGTTGHTDTRRTQRINENTAFRVASVSKTFAAGLAAVLVAEGAFSWDDRVVDHLPWFHLKGDAGVLRIRDLLGQSTGLIPHAYDNLIEDGLPMERIVPKLSTLGYICEPGDCYSYQNIVFSLIEPVMEQSTQRGYAALMNEKIFAPLDMRNASVGLAPLVDDPNHARPHVKSRGQWRTVKVQPNYYRVAPAAGVNASVLDMAKWLMAQMGANPEVLAPSMVRTLTDPRVATRRDLRRKYWRDILTDAHYGLGWRVYRVGAHELVYHSGWVSGYRADIAWSEEYGLGLAILMNAEGSTISELSTDFWQRVFRHAPAGGGELLTATAASR
ncbi:MAG: serine hydrolase [Xanthomonadales bacterium]